MSAVNQSESDPSAECLEAAGPWPFVTRRVYRSADATKRVWSSRHHRKGLLLQAAGESRAVAANLRSWLWKPGSLNWWIGGIFAVGSLLFAVGSVLSLSPAVAQAISLDSQQINAIFFAGSIPFTTAAYLQLYQAANVGEFLDQGSPTLRRRAIVGWRPNDIGWVSSALQFVGTILFNFNTFDATIPSLNWFRQDLLIWVPDFIGSVLFLMSGYLAFEETCHARWAWLPNSVSWWVVVTNLLGCVGFMISAILGVVLPTPNDTAVTLSVVFTLLGAIGFLVGSLLMLPETAMEPQS